MVADAIKLFNVPKVDTTREAQVVAASKESCAAIHKHMQKMLHINPELMTNATKRREKLCDLIIDEFRKYTKDELLFIVGVVIGEAMIENY